MWTPVTNDRIARGASLFHFWQRVSCDDHYFSYGVTVVMHTMWKRTRRLLFEVSFRFFPSETRARPARNLIFNLLQYFTNCWRFLAQQRQTRGEIFCKRVCLLILQLIHHYPVNSSSVSAVMPSSCARQYFWSKRSLPKWPSSIFSLASRFAFREGDWPADRDFTSNINGKIVIAAAKILCRDATVGAIFINNRARWLWEMVCWPPMKPNTDLFTENREKRDINGNTEG